MSSLPERIGGGALQPPFPEADASVPAYTGALEHIRWVAHDALGFTAGGRPEDVAYSIYGLGPDLRTILLARGNHNAGGMLD